MLYRPASRLEAACFEGTRLQYNWTGDNPGFYDACIVKVPEEAVEGDEAGIYLSIKFLDEPESTEHDIEWAEFEDPDSAQISWIPEAARRQQLKQRELAQQKGKQVLGVAAKDVHAHLFEEGNGQIAGRPSKRQRVKANSSSRSSREVSQDFVAGRWSRRPPSRLQNGRPGGVANGAAAHVQRDMVIADSASETSSASTDSIEVAPPPRPAKRLQHEVDSQADVHDGEEQAAQAGPAQKKQRQMQEAQGPSSERSTERNTGPYQPVPSGDGRGNAGHAKRLVLENFMCHEHIVIDFLPNMNFVCGENGSGKTAVLHGLQTCLGVSAKQSGRASSAAALIKDDANHSRAAATLWNTGHDAFLPKRYGSEVTIVREMKRTATGATSSWAILDERGKKVAGKKAEVDELLSALNINAANPAICLTQDTARSFGGSRADQERYKVYMEATQFDQIIEALKLAEVQVEEMRHRSKDMHKSHKETEQQKKQVDEKVGILKEADIWSAQLADLDDCIAWEHVMEPKRAAEECQRQLDGKAKEKAEELAERRRLAEENLQTASAQHEAQLSAVSAHPQRLDALRAEQEAAQELYRQAHRGSSGLRRELQQLQRRLQEKQETLQSIQEAIEELRTQLQEASHEEEEALGASLRQKLQDAEAADVAAGLARQELREAQAAVAQAAGQVREAERVKSGAVSSVNGAQASLSRLKGQQRGDPISMFGGEQVRQLVSKVRQAVEAGQFARPPQGPIGSLLTLTDDKWALAVEMSIGKVFGSFIVHNYEDSKVLQRLIRETFTGRGRSPNVVVFDFDIPEHDLNAPSSRNPRQVPSEHPTVFRVLRTKDTEYDHVVRNVLIDHCAAERLLLVESEVEGMQAIRSEMSQRRVITSAWARDGWMGWKKGANETSKPPQPSQRMNARLRKDTAAAVREVEAELRNLQEAQVAAQEQLAAARAEERAAQQAVHAARSNVAAKDAAKFESDSQVQELRTQRDAQAQPDEASVADQELQRAEAANAVSSTQRMINEKQQALASAEAKEAAESEVWEAKRREHSAALASFGKENEAMATAHAAAQAAEDVLQTILQRQEQLGTAINQLKAKQAEFLAKSEGHREGAKQMCSEAEYAESLQTIAEPLQKRRDTVAHLPEEEQPMLGQLMERLKTELERKIQAKEQDVGATMEELLAKQDALERALQKSQKVINKIDYNLGRLQDSYVPRKEKARRMRKDTLHAVENNFNSNLNRRGFTGGIYINKDEGTLALKVKPDPNAKEAVTDMKSLSGGERSFTNMCFLLALGKQISSPFHCLDEFDVFMDAFNRRLSIEMLIRFGVHQEHVQFILLTPQGTSAVEGAVQRVRQQLKDEYPAGPFVQIRQMHAPRPNTST